MVLQSPGPVRTEILSIVVNARQRLCNDFKWPHLKLITINGIHLK